MPKALAALKILYGDRPLTLAQDGTRRKY
jgi:hypothetical protein